MASPMADRDLLPPGQTLQVVVATVVPRSVPATVPGRAVRRPNESSLEALDRKLQPGHVLTGSKVCIDRKVAEGDMGYVYRVRDTSTEAVSALKVSPMERMNAVHLSAEAEWLRRLEHPCIVTVQRQFIYDIRATQYLCTLMEFCDEGSVAQFIERRWASSENSSSDMVRDILMQLAHAVGYIHAKGLLHGNLSSDSVLLTAAHQVKLTGFGHTTIPWNPETSLVGSGTLKAHTPPEWVERTSLTQPSSNLPSSFDMWGLGCVAAELATQTLLSRRVPAGKSLAHDEASMQGLLVELARAHRGAFLPLAQQLLQVAPGERLAAPAVVQRLSMSSRGLSKLLRSLKSMHRRHSA